MVGEKHQLQRDGPGIQELKVLVETQLILELSKTLVTKLKMKVPAYDRGGKGVEREKQKIQISARLTVTVF